jgi:DNA ligase (NAD+)
LANIQLSGKVRLGEKRTERFIEEIEKKRNLSLSDFLGSLGIFGLGKRRVALIQEALPGQLDNLSDWFTNILVEKATEAGVPNIAQRIHDDIVKQKKSIMKFIENGVVIIKPQPKKELKKGAFVFCITGALSSPKAKFKELIENSGHGYTDTFNKSVTHLIAADINSGSAKLEKAKKQGINVINEKELMDILKK